jgi:chondroitin 4-sulfotransferase 11
MVSHKGKFIFVHIPKCAGTSIIERIGLSNSPPCHAPITFHPKNIRDAYFKFTFVRNPWDRFVSAYFYLKNGGNGTAPQDLRSQKRINKYESFSDFIKCDNFFTMEHFKSCSSYLNGPIDFIGKVENLQEDFNIVCDKIGIPRQKLPKKNQTKHKHYTEYYNDESREYVWKKFAPDIKHFGYKFGE